MIVRLTDRRIAATRELVIGLFGLVALLAQSLPAAAQNGPAAPCDRIMTACRNAGFVRNSPNPGTGLIIDCVRPIMQNKPQPANAKLPLPRVNPQLVDACLAANPNFGQAGGGAPAAAGGDEGPGEYAFNGDNYGWYEDGWNGAGWYIVGYEFRRGHGFGGREGFHGWKHRGSHPHRAGGRPHQGGNANVRHPRFANHPRRAGGGPRHVQRNFRPHRNAGGGRHFHRNAGPRRHAGGQRHGGRVQRHAGGGRRGGGGHRGGGRRKSDIRLKHDIVMLGHLDNGLGFYRFSYNGSTKAYVGVMAQEVQAIRPEAVVRGKDGYLLVDYDQLGLRMQQWDDWVASGRKIPAATVVSH